MKRSAKAQQLTFQAKLERIAEGVDYFAFPVPAKVTRTLGIVKAVPILARVNDSAVFRGSLFPIGGGRHYMRVKASVRKEAKIAQGDRARIEITVVDRSTETNIPKDLLTVLQGEKVTEDFKALPEGKRAYMIRWIDQAAKPETRAKRIQSAVEAAHQKRERRLAKSSK
jgi:hypothetical protein